MAVGGRARLCSLYRDTRAQLIEEQGTDPGPILSELHQRILSQDPQLAAPAPAAGQVASRPPTRCRCQRRSSLAATLKSR